MRPRRRVHLRLDPQHRRAGAGGASARCAPRAARSACARSPRHRVLSVPGELGVALAQVHAAARRRARRTPRARSARSPARPARPGSAPRARARRARRARRRANAVANRNAPSPHSSAPRRAPRARRRDRRACRSRTPTRAARRPAPAGTARSRARCGGRRSPATTSRARVAQRVREQVEARDRDHRDAQRLRQHLRGGHADAQAGEHARARCRPRSPTPGRASTPICSQQYSIAGASRSAWRGGPASACRRARRGRACRLRDASTTPTAPGRGLDPEQQHQRARPIAQRLLDGSRPRRASADRGTTSSSTRSVVGGAGLDPHDDDARPAAPARRVAPLDDGHAARRRPARRSRGRGAPGPGRAGTRRRARPAAGPSYSCTIVNVGLVTGSRRRRARAPAPARTSVLPAPRSPIEHARGRRPEQRAERGRDRPRGFAAIVGRHGRRVMSARASARFTRTKSARDSASALPPDRSTADGCSVGRSTASMPGARERELLARAAS